jgi:hypothetical protein
MMDTHHMVCDFGKFEGERYTRIPVSYLKWMVNVDHTHADIAEAELERRGTVTPTIEVSGHSIDRASLSCLKLWQLTRKKDEGIHAWLIRLAQGALDSVEGEIDGKILHMGMKFVFEADGVWPVLKTVMPGTWAQQKEVRRRHGQDQKDSE